MPPRKKPTRIEGQPNPLGGSGGPPNPSGDSEEHEANETPEEELKEIACRLSNEVGVHLNTRKDREGDWDRFVQLYNSKPKVEKKTYPWPGASNVTVGLSAIYVDTLVARILQSILPLQPHWVLSPLNKTFTPIAKPLERYLDWARDNVWNQERVLKPAVLEMCKMGTAVIFNGWEDLTLRKTTPGGQTVDAGRRRGPRPQWVPLMDFLIPSGFNNINDSEDGPRAPWIAMRQWWSRQDLERLSFSGEFDRDVTQKVIESPSSDPKARVRDLSASRRTGSGIITSTDTNPLTDLYETWQVWFSQDVDRDGYPEEWVAIIHLDTEEVLRFQPNPYIQGMRPFTAIKLVEIEGQFYGVGIPQMIEMYQEEITTIHNQRRDGSAVGTVPVWKTRKGAGINLKQRISPGDVIPCTDPEKDLIPLATNLSIFQTVPEEQLCIQLAERRIGISDINLGQESSPLGRAAATTVMALMQEGSRRFDLNVSEIRRGITEQGLQIIELYQAHGIPDPDESGAPEIVLDPQEAQAVRTFLQTPDSVRGVVGLRMNAATAAINREVEKQSNLQIFQLILSYYQQIAQGIIPALVNPQIPPQVKQVLIDMVLGADKILKDRIFQSHGAFDLDEVLIGDLLTPLAAAPPPMPMGMPSGIPGPPGAAPPGGPPPGAGQLPLPGRTGSPFQPGRGGPPPPTPPIGPNGPQPQRT